MAKRFWPVALLTLLLLTGTVIPCQIGERAAADSGRSFSISRAEAFWPWDNSQAEELTFGELYSGASSMGLQFSEKVQRLNGKQVVVTGFMAPPLKPTLNFFVLTKVPMAICPFCSTDADWPDDILVVKLERPVTALPYDAPIRVTGRLDVGSEIDPETGFVSLLRIYANNLEKVE